MNRGLTLENLVKCLCTGQCFNVPPYLTDIFNPVVQDSLSIQMMLKQNPLILDQI